MMDTHAEQGREAAGEQPARFRYGIVFLLVFLLVVFVIAAPAANWSRAVVLALEGVALVVAVATARESREARYGKAMAVGVVMLAVVAVTAAGDASMKLTATANALATAAIPVLIGHGLVRLLRERGVTIQAVAGALAVYLSVGLVFAWIIDVVIRLDSTLFFAQHTNGTEGERVYYSFTTMTTTGFGDFSAATPTGHALAVVEMLTGQLYLVTVIGLLVGNFVGRRMPGEAGAER